MRFMVWNVLQVYFKNVKQVFHEFFEKFLENYRLKICYENVFINFNGILCIKHTSKIELPQGCYIGPILFYYNKTALQFSCLKKGL